MQHRNYIITTLIIMYLSTGTNLGDTAEALRTFFKPLLTLLLNMGVNFWVNNFYTHKVNLKLNNEDHNERSRITLIWYLLALIAIIPLSICRTHALGNLLYKMLNAIIPNRW